MLHVRPEIEVGLYQKDSLFRAICELPLLTKRESCLSTAGRVT